MRTASSRRRPAASPPHLAMPILGLALVFALFVVACSAGGSSGSSSTAGNGGSQSQTFSAPPTIQTTPPVATAVGTEQPSMPGVPGITPTQPGQIPAFSADDMANFVMRHGLPNVDMSGSPTVTQKLFLPNSEVEQLTGYTTGFSADAMVGYVELQGNFSFPTPPNVPAVQLPVAYMMFNTVSGDLIGWGGLKQPSTPTTSPTATPVSTQLAATPTTAPPTATPVPQNPPVLSVTPLKTTAFCSQGSYPNPITVTNTGGGTLTWNGVAPTGVTLTPANGSLDAGASQTVMLSGAVAGVASFTIRFDSNGGAAAVTITCEVIG
jgi:hypothetical protein